MVDPVGPRNGHRAPDGGATVVFDNPDWHDEWKDGDEPIPQPPETAVTGSTASLKARGAVSLSTAAGVSVRSDRSTPTDLPTGTYRLTVRAHRSEKGVRPAAEASVRETRSSAGGDRRPTEVGIEPGTEALVRFAGPARVRGGDNGLEVSFPDRSCMEIGFRSTLPGSETIVVPETPAGVATAITHLSSALRTTGPDRSHPVFRAHPPLVEFGDREVPESVQRATPETGLVLFVPASIGALLTAAPLAYYLGACVEVGDRSAPVLRDADGVFERRFRPMPAFQHDVAATLRRVFLLDCLTRTIDPGAVTAAGGAALDRIGVRSAELSETTPAERLRRYCEIPSSRIRPELPEWHLSTYVEPIVGNARSLPYLLDDLSLIYHPSASELDGKGLLRRSLDDFYRTEEIASIDRLEPELHAGRAHGWLAPGTPIDVFKSSHAAYEHRLAYGESESPLDVTVVFNDPEMGGEHDRVAEIYRERAVDLPADVTVEENLTRAELKAVFETPNDFVHFIGHCDTGGLRCSDGSFPAASLETCRTRTFFLNACGSYHEGLDLIAAGGVAGAVTLTAVLNDHAATVGTAFARLLIYGFDIERAIQLARRRIMMGKDYAVVGDGTHTLAANESGPPPVVWLADRGDRFDLAYEVVTTGTAGGTYRPSCGDDDRTYLQGVNASIDLSRPALVTFLEDSSLPVVYDGDLRWSTELAARLES